MRTVAGLAEVDPVDEVGGTSVLIKNHLQLSGVGCGGVGRRERWWRGPVGKTKAERQHTTRVVYKLWEPVFFMMFVLFRKKSVTVNSQNSFFIYEYSTTCLLKSIYPMRKPRWAKLSSVL